MDTREAAVRLARFGLSVVPLRPRPEGGDPSGMCKRPAIAWKHLQTTRLSEDEINDHWTCHAGCGVGIVTGAVSGVVVVDCDDADAITWAADNLPASPVMTKTPKGLHLFFRHPGVPVANRAHIKIGGTARKLDIRGDGGYVVAAPSPHPSGVVYEEPVQWSAAAFEAMPTFEMAWIASEASARTKPSTSKVSSSPAAPPPPPEDGWVGGDDNDRSEDDRVSRARAWMRKRDIPAEGERNDALHKTAVAVFCTFDLERPDGEHLLRQFVSAFPGVPLDDKEISASIESAWKWTRTQTRGTGLKDDVPRLSDARAARERRRAREARGASGTGAVAVAQAIVPDAVADDNAVPIAPDEQPAERLARVMYAETKWMGVDRSTGIAFAARVTGEHIEPVAIDSKQMDFWVLDVVRACAAPLTRELRAQVKDLVERESNRGQIELGLRWHRDENGIRIDLGDDQWRHVHARTDGTWSIGRTEDPMFRRSKSIEPFPEPDATASAPDLVPALVEALGIDERVAQILACWAVHASMVGVPRIGLLIRGPRGSGKSVVARSLRRLIDPAVPELLSPPGRNREPRDEVYIHTDEAAVIAYDNVSRITEETSDLLCRIITGDGYLARQLHTTRESYRRTVKGLVLMTTISMQGVGADLQDRLLSVELPSRSNFATEEELDARWSKIAPRATGALFAAIAGMLKARAAVDAEHGRALERSRMRDAVSAMAAAARALGLDPGAIIGRVMSSRIEAAQADLSVDVVGARVLAYVSTHDHLTTMFDGTLTEFEQDLLRGVERPDDWPRSVRGLRGMIDRLVPSLLAEGIKVEFYRKPDRSKSASIRLLPVAQEAAEPPAIVPVFPEVHAVAFPSIDEVCGDTTLIELPQDIPLIPRATSKITVDVGYAGREPEHAVEVLRSFVNVYGAVALPLVRALVTGEISGWDEEERWAAALEVVVHGKPDEQLMVLEGACGSMRHVTSPAPFGTGQWQWYCKSAEDVQRICAIFAA